MGVYVGARRARVAAFGRGTRALEMRSRKAIQRSSYRAAEVGVGVYIAADIRTPDRLIAGNTPERREEMMEESLSADVSTRALQTCVAFLSCAAPTISSRRRIADTTVCCTRPSTLVAQHWTITTTSTSPPHLHTNDYDHCMTGIRDGFGRRRILGSRSSAAWHHADVDLPAPTNTTSKNITGACS